MEKIIQSLRGQQQLQEGGSQESEDNQYDNNYATSEKMLLDEAEHLYDKMIAESMSHQTTDEIQNTNPDHAENGVPIIKVEYEKNVG
jgi:hypothetical protein